MICQLFVKYYFTDFIVHRYLALMPTIQSRDTLLKIYGYGNIYTYSKSCSVKTVESTVSFILLYGAHMEFKQDTSHSELNSLRE